VSVRCASDAEASFVELLAWAKDLPARDGLGVLRSWRDRLDVSRSQVLADQRAAGLNDRQLDRLMGSGSGSTTRADRHRVKKRAETLGRNASLADDVASGDLTVDQLDAICDADAKTGGQAANDPGLLAEITSTPADTARRTADKWVAERTSNEEREERRRRQRARREARKGQTTDGLASLTISGDDECVAQMWSSIATTADRFYVDDGGRDVAAGKHPRTNAQRLFDAAYQHLTAGSDLDSGSPKRRPEVTVVVTAQKLAGNDSAPAEMIGVGPIPDTLLQELSCGAGFVGMLFDGTGEVLWQGRRRRYPTRAQMLALIARDRGCVLCGAEPSRCHAHHCMPWSAPGKGETDVGEMALVCAQHHRYIHEQNLTLYRDRLTGRWRTRPATPNETPRPRRPNANAPP